MHRHRKVLPLICLRRTQIRPASSATKAQPKAEPPSSNTVQPNLSKWAPPPSVQRSLSGTKWEIPNKPSQPPPSTSANAPRSSTSPSNVSSRSWIPQQSSSSNSQSTPQRGWQRVIPAAPTPAPASSQSPSSQATNVPSTPQATVKRPVMLDRDVAPHTTARLNERPASHPQKQANTSSSPSDSWDTPVEPVEDEPLPFAKKSNRLQFGVKPERRRRGSMLEQLEQAPQTFDDSQWDYAGSRAKQKVKKHKALVEKKIAADVYIPSVVSVGALAQLLNVKLDTLQRRMERSGMAKETSHDYVLTSDYAILLAEEFGRNPIVNDEMAFNIYPSPPHANPSSLPSRPPVVTIMGHVDHGKTTLLDTLRSSSVAKGEAGGITQHIGAFSVPVPSNSNSGPRTITFLDTPGHAAFSAMRARGAGVTDIIVLVVAADDGIMPQTREVISLIKKEQDKIGVVVAINKVDKPGVDTEAVQKALLAEGIQLETFGGDVPSVAVSGLTGQGLPNLVEILSAIAEIQDLRAEHDGPVHGYVLESKVHKGLGAVATVLVLRGCLKVGSHIISGVSQARVRVLTDSAGKSVKAATPGMAVTVSGWKMLPNAGDEVLQGSELDIKKAIANRLRKAEIEASLVDVEAINESRRQERERRELEIELGKDAVAALDRPPEGPKELRLVVKADVSGSAEAVVGALQGIGNHVATTKIISSGVGDVTESDVTMARTAGGIIVAFSVNVPKQIEVVAAQNNVSIVSSGIIYRLMDEVKEHVIKLLPVIVEKTVTGEATVLQLFDVQSKKQTIRVAGCRVTNGLLERAKQVRVVRDGQTLHEGPMETLRVIKKDVTEVRKGSECGLSLVGFSELKEGDLVQVFSIVEKPGIL